MRSRDERTQEAIPAMLCRKLYSRAPQPLLAQRERVTARLPALWVDLRQPRDLTWSPT